MLIFFQVLFELSEEDIHNSTPEAAALPSIDGTGAVKMEAEIKVGPTLVLQRRPGLFSPSTLQLLLILASEIIALVQMLAKLSDSITMSEEMLAIHAQQQAAQKAQK